MIIILIHLVLALLIISLASAASMFITGYLEEGQTTIYETERGTYIVNLVIVSDNEERAVFSLNNEMSKGMDRNDIHVFKDGSEIVLKDLSLNAYEDAPDGAYYYFYGTGEGVLNLRNISMYVLENELCNFDRECDDESKEYCCYDCGCDDGMECINNKCTLIEEKNETVEEEKEEAVVEVEEEAEPEEKEEPTKEKKAAYVLLITTSIFILIMGWVVVKKKRSII